MEKLFVIFNVGMILTPYTRHNKNSETTTICFQVPLYFSTISKKSFKMTSFPTFDFS